jgi:hypothetical protein
MDTEDSSRRHKINLKKKTDGSIKPRPDRPSVPPAQYPQSPSQQQTNNLSQLEHDFNLLMERSVMFSYDEFSFKCAYFKPESSSEFDSLENQILLAGKLAGHDKKPWIAMTKNTFLASRSTPFSIKANTLSTLKNDYIFRLHELDKDTRYGSVNFSDAELSKKRRKVIALGESMGYQLGKWCDERQEKVLRDRASRRAAKRKAGAIAAVAVIIVVSIVMWVAVKYRAAEVAKVECLARINQADSVMNSGQPEEALDIYREADRNYDVIFYSESLKFEINHRIERASEQIIKDWIEKVTRLLLAHQPTEAKKLTQSLPANLILSEQMQSDIDILTKKIDYDLYQKANATMYELTDALFLNDGQLTDTQMNQLDEMLSFCPHHPGLLRIKKRATERKRGNYR